MKSVNDHYGVEDEDISRPPNYKTIMQNQQNYYLINNAKNNKDFSIQNFHGVNK